MQDPTVHILLATFQGEAFLSQQLDSIRNQTYTHWVLHISDDGSTDRTREIIAGFVSTLHQPVEIYVGPQKGVTHNFFHLLSAVPAANSSDLYAFCDQDDVWLPGKLQHAVLQYSTLVLAPDQPYLYASRAVIVDQALAPNGFTAFPQKSLGFGNALLQNVANGNTMVFNAAQLKIMRHISPENAVLHDWAAYLVVTACGGVLYFGKEPLLLYRQHTSNLVGSNLGLGSQLQRMKFMLNGGYKNWADRTIKALCQIYPHLTEQSKKELHAFKLNRSLPNPLSRLKMLWNGTVWRQTRRGQLSLALALILNLI